MKFCAIVIVILAMFACNTEKHYKTLSFFFDGVPPPDEAVQEIASTVQENKRPVLSLKDPFLSKHKPWVERQCDRCHDKTKSSFLRSPPETLCFVCHDKDMFEDTFIHGPVSVSACLSCHRPHRAKATYLLNAEGAELCFQCHNQSTIYDNRNHIEGESCTKCHYPHAADNIFLLKPRTTQGGS